MNRSNGFTLVEISIVMIVIGLIIGGTFGGLVLIENMKVTTTVQQIKNIESAAIKFRDSFGTLPGDVRDPSVILSNCTAAPCTNTGGANNGDGVLMASRPWTNGIDPVSERFVFWHQLLAVGMLDGYQPVNNFVFGQGQPLSAIETGFRIFYDRDATRFHGICLTNREAGSIGGTTVDDLVIKGTIARKLDEKLDDGVANIGKFTVWNTSLPSPTYDINADYGARYIYNF